jgi:universal stress protein A
MAYNKILVALDFADDYQHIINAGANLASDGAEIHVLAVVRALAGYYGGEYGGLGTEAANLEQQARDFARGKLDEVGETLGVSADHLHLEIGQPAARIRALAEELEVDAIVLGTHGRHGLGRLLGSTAIGVLHGVQCDALVVKVQ